MQLDKNPIKDELDLTSFLSILFDNFNLLISIFITSFFAIGIYYLSATNTYLSDSLLEIKNENNSFLPRSLSGFQKQSENSLEAEIAIYKSKDTLQGALKRLKEFEKDSAEQSDLSLSDISSGLSLKSDSVSLLSISFKSSDKELSTLVLDFLNQEYIQDRKDFAKKTTTAGKSFISQEIPRIKILLKEAENNLNTFKISTNTADVIFDIETRNSELNRLRNRVNEIEFKELELKEFYKENHPIYLTLSQQKQFLQSQILDIENELPSIPSTQRTLENFKREVDIYSNVLKDLSSQELALGMTEASSTSNVRIINNASPGKKISPRLSIFIFTLVATIIVYIILSIRHFLGDLITNQDALIDYLGKELILGELPYIDDFSTEKNNLSLNIANELLNKSVYKITHSEDKIQSISVVGSRKDVGKTEVSKRLFEKLKANHKVCLLDLDYRKGGLTKEFMGSNEESFKSINEFLENQDKYKSENDSLFVPSLNIDSPQDFFISEDFKAFIESIKNDFDYVICDTPPWKLFVDAQIVSQYFDTKLFVVCNGVTTFTDVDQFRQDIKDEKKIQFFYNKFNLYFNFLWYKYQYPYYARNYYYDYHQYSNLSQKYFFSVWILKIRNFISRFLSK